MQLFKRQSPRIHSKQRQPIFLGRTGAGFHSNHESQHRNYTRYYSAIHSMVFWAYIHVAADDGGRWRYSRHRNCQLLTGYWMAGGGGLAGGVLRVGGGGRAGGTQHKRAGLAGAGDIPAAIAINKSYNAAGGGVRGA